MYVVLWVNQDQTQKIGERDPERASQMSMTA
jgi:hypothetical protein